MDARKFFGRGAPWLWLAGCAAAGVPPAAVGADGAAPEHGDARGAIDVTALSAPDASTTDAPVASDTSRPDDAAASDVSASDAPAPGADRRASFLRQLRAVVGPPPPLEARLEPASTGGGLLTQDFSFASTSSWRVPGTSRRMASASGKLPVAICLHETGSDRDSANVVALATALAGRGFLSVAISGRYFGKGGGNDAYVAAMKAAYADPGHDYPFLYDTVWDVTRLVDYLVTRDDVDPARIGLLGVSKGGMETFLAAAVDLRIAAAAPIIGVQSFKWGLEHDAFQARAESLGGAVPNPGDAASVRRFYDRVAPGLVDLYDGPDMLPLIAPRPLVVISGTQDPRNAIAGVRLAVAAAQPAYQQLGAAAKLELFTADVGHDGGYRPFHDRAVAWLVQWLGQPR